MIPTIQTLILLLFVNAMVGVAETRLRIPSAILLVLVGRGLALVPGLPPSNWRPNWCCCWCCRRSSIRRQWR